MTRFNEAFATEAERDAYVLLKAEEEMLFNVEQAKAHIIADLHRLSALVGHDAARAFVKTEWSDIAF